MGSLPDKLEKKYNELAEFFDQPTWKNRILFYAFIFVSIALVFTIMFGSFKFIFIHFTIPTNTAYTQYNVTELSNMGFYDNERYLLSALVQSLAAVIALVITLSLVAVQLAAQSYSPRVIDVYKRNPDMWILLGIYILTIFYGLGLIKIIGLGILSNYMEDAIFVAYFMGFFAFVCLVPYMLKTLDLLKPSTVIKLLAMEINKENILELFENDEYMGEYDPVQPIIDMINGALGRNDYETVRNGLACIKDFIIQIFESTHFIDIENDELSHHIVVHIRRVGIQSANMQNEESTAYTIITLEKIGIKAAEKGFELTTDEVIYALGKLGIKAAERELGWRTSEVVDALKNIKDKVDKNISIYHQEKSKIFEWTLVMRRITESLQEIEEAKEKRKNS